MLIRPATLSDIPAITAIYGASVVTGTASFELAAPDEAEMGRRMAALGGSGHPFLAAERAGRLLGYAYAGPYRPRPAYANTVEDSLYVAAEAQRQGVGRALLRALVVESAARGFRQMIAVIGDSNHAASIRLHAAEGFAMVGTLKNVGYKHGRWLDSVLMQRSLGAGETTPPTR